MKKSLRALGAALLALSTSTTAFAQPGQPSAAPEAPPKEEKAKPPPAPQLPPGHPPVDPSKMMDPSRREQLRQLLDQRQRQRQQQQGQQQPGQAPVAPAPALPSTPTKPKAPRDEHGHCLGQGPDDRPKDINLFHGWLGSKHELGEAGEGWSKAIRAPAPKGSKEWWYWRLTPYPYRYDNHDDHCDPANQPVPLIANILNLAALAFILVRFGRKPIAEALKGRKRTIMHEFDKAAEIKRSARSRLDDYEDQLDNLEGKLQSLREQYAAEGRHEEERVRADAARRRDRMLADAAFRVSQEGKTARDALSREALEAALTAAEELIQNTVTQADHDRLAAEYLDQVGPAFLTATIGEGRGGTS